MGSSDDAIACVDGGLYVVVVASVRVAPCGAQLQETTLEMKHLITHPLY